MAAQALAARGSPQTARGHRHRRRAGGIGHPSCRPRCGRARHRRSGRQLLSGRRLPGRLADDGVGAGGFGGRPVRLQRGFSLFAVQAGVSDRHRASGADISASRHAVVLVLRPHAVGRCDLSCQQRHPVYSDLLLFCAYSRHLGFDFHLRFRPDARHPCAAGFGDDVRYASGALFRDALPPHGLSAFVDHASSDGRSGGHRGREHQRHEGGEIFCGRKAADKGALQGSSEAALVGHGHSGGSCPFQPAD